MTDQKQLLRNLPKIDSVLKDINQDIADRIPIVIVKTAVRETLDFYRQAILRGENITLPASDSAWHTVFAKAILKKNKPNLTRIINGSGVVVHTNLGRSLLDKSSLESLQTAATHYTNLEFDLNTGKRGSRYALVEEIICDLTGAEAAIVVNNNAAAVLLSLNTLSFNKETIVSRGQLVEIGGSFRIPDVMTRSGALLVEVGATNRTHLFDYEDAITDETALLLKVHTSNFRVIGFTSEVPAADLAALASPKNILTMEDLGSGSLVDLSPWGLPKEPTVQEIVQAGVDVVTFSGDKLLGGPQAGIIVGKKEVVAKIKKNPMNRALRIDKFTLASLESVLRKYYDFENVMDSVPTLRLLTLPPEQIQKTGEQILRRLGDKRENKSFIQLLPSVSKVGGGAMPEHTLKSWALVLSCDKHGASWFEKWFRFLPIPVLVRIENEKIVIDLRTILEDDLSDLVNVLELYLEVEKGN